MDKIKYFCFLKSARKLRGISQIELAKKTGLNKFTIYLIENEKQIPTIVTAFKICNALNLRLEEVFNIWC